MIAMSTIDTLTIRPPRTALLVIDVQERLAAAMAEPVRVQLERQVATLIATAGRFELPILVSEQYPRGLGRTTPAIQAARQVSTSIPLVTPATASPMLVAASLARPGGSVTGLTPLNNELVGKRLQLLSEIVPGLARVAHLTVHSNPANVSSWKELEQAARSLKVEPLTLDVRRREDLEPAIARAAKERVGALFVSIDGLHQANATLIIEAAAKQRLPAIYQSREFALKGGLISYGVNYPDLYRRTASYVVRIFNGARPGDLPMEQPTKFDMVVNLKTAKALGLKIPQSVLLRADEVIE